jgi:hypothetical protein
MNVYVSRSSKSRASRFVKFNLSRRVKTLKEACLTVEHWAMLEMYHIFDVTINNCTDDRVDFMILVSVSDLVIVLDEKKRKLAKRPFPTLKRFDGLNSVSEIEERDYSRWLCSHRWYSQSLNGPLGLFTPVMTAGIALVPKGNIEI